MSASAELSDMYKEYLDGLGLKDREGKELNSGNFRAFIESLMVSELERAKAAKGPEAMLAEIEAPKYDGDGSPCENNGWLQFGPDGEILYDFGKHLYYLGKYTPLNRHPPFPTGACWVPRSTRILFSEARRRSFARSTSTHGTMTLRAMVLARMILALTGMHSWLLMTAGASHFR